MNDAPRKTVFVAASAAQRKALTSPVRQEILSNFAGEAGLSVTDLAERMGRPATALYYHVSQLEELGFLETAGERRKGKRYESVYRPTAEMYEMDAEAEGGIDDVVRTVEVATRTSVREMRDALESGRGRKDGPGRNLMAFRLQGQVNPETLETVNEHIDAILSVLSDTCGKPMEGDTEFISLTLALMPLKGRNPRSDS